MPCPVRELGASAPLMTMAVLVAQAIVPVPRVDWGFACAKRENQKTRRVGLADVARACWWRLRARHAVPLRKKPQIQVRRPAIRRAPARRTMSRCVPSNLRSWCVVTLAQAGLPVLLNCHGERNDSTREPSICDLRRLQLVAQAEAYATGSARCGRGLARRSLYWRRRSIA